MTANLFGDLMQQGDTREIYDFIVALHSVDDFIYKDDETETNALHIACSSDSPIRDQVVILLVRLNASINHPAKVAGISNMTALHLATLHEFNSTVEILLNLGADVDLPDSSRFTPYCYASKIKSQATQLLSCFKSDFPSSRKIIDLRRKTTIITTNNNDTSSSSTTKKEQPNKTADSGTTRRGSVDKSDTRIDHHHDNSSYKNIEPAKVKRELEIVREIPPPPPPASKTNNNGGLVSSSVKLLPKIKWKGRTRYDEPPGFIVVSKDSDAKYKVSLDDLQKHEPFRLRTYIRSVCRMGGEKWRRLKDGFGQVKIKQLLDKKVPSKSTKAKRV